MVGPVILKGPLEPDGLSVGACHTPRPFPFCVCARTGAGVVVLVQPAHKVVGLSRVRGGPEGGREDVAAELLTQMHGRRHELVEKREGRKQRGGGRR